MKILSLNDKDFQVSIIRNLANAQIHKNPIIIKIALAQTLRATVRSDWEIYLLPATILSSSFSQPTSVTYFRETAFD